MYFSDKGGQQIEKNNFSVGPCFLYRYFCYGGGCYDVPGQDGYCHVPQQNAPGVTQELQNLHATKPGKIEGFGKDVAHKLCICCHKTEGNGKGPTTCMACHKKSESLKQNFGNSMERDNKTVVIPFFYESRLTRITVEEIFGRHDYSRANYMIIFRCSPNAL